MNEEPRLKSGPFKGWKESHVFVFVVGSLIIVTRAVLTLIH